MGGIYLDTDVYALKNFNDFLNNKFFSFVEYHHDSIEHVILSAFVGCEKGHLIAKKFCEYFDDNSFKDPFKNFDDVLLCPDIFAKCIKEFGFKDIDETQKLNNGTTIYNSDYVAGTIDEYKKNNFAVHCCAGS